MGVMKLPPALSRLLGLCQLALGRKTEALQTLAMAPDDLESQVVRIEVMAQDNPQAALDRARSLGDTSSDKRLNKIRWRLIGELSIQLRQPEPAREAGARKRVV